LPEISTIMKRKNYNIALTQISLDGTPEVNLKKCLEWIRKAAQQGANVVCLPELYSSFYFCQSENHDYFDLAEPLHNDSYKAFSALAAELGVVLIVPFFERRASGLYHNSAYIIDTDGSQAGLYRKMHIPDDPSYYEKFYFTPGDIGKYKVDLFLSPDGYLSLRTKVPQLANRNLDLLGPMVSGRSAYYRVAGRRNTLLPYRHWLASV